MGRRSCCATLVAALVIGLGGCTGGSAPQARPTPSGATGPVTASPSGSAALSSAPAVTPSPTASPARIDTAAVLRDIRHLASAIGPREATSAGFQEAADFVAARFEKLGYRVTRTSVRVPAGSSWGVPVKAGRSANLIAEPARFDSTEPHVVIGAHLDTVAVAPGAEDNASGVAVMLELARLVAAQPPDLPVRFVAFGAEEPRGTGDSMHHFGSRQLVAGLSRAERRAIRGMVALDRVGVRASYVPVCVPPNGEGRTLQQQVRAAARAVDVSTRGCTLTTSDHWSYAKAGISAIRLGSIPYAGYHSRGDTVQVVDRRQLGRVTTLTWAWLLRLPA